MIRTLLLVGVCFASIGDFAFAQDSKMTSVVKGLKNPESVCYAANGKLYLTEIGEDGKDGDGQISLIENGKASAFATGLNDPKGLCALKDTLFVADKTRVMAVNSQGKVSVFVDAKAFPVPPLYLNDIAIEPRSGVILVSDSGDTKGKEGKVYRIHLQSRKVDVVADTNTIPGLKIPNGVAFDGETFFILADMEGALYRVNLADKKAAKFAEGMPGADGLIWDKFGSLYVTSWATGKVYAIPRPGKAPVSVVESGITAAADGCVSADGKSILIPDMKAGTLTSIPNKIAGWEVDDSPLDVKFEVAFPDLKWTGWDDGSESGRVNQFRPILLTHAGDGSGRIFVASQQGVLHAFKPGDKETKIFFDLSKKIRYLDRMNEEGLLGVAFHPKFKENGQVYIFYTDVKAKMANVVSRLTLKKGAESIDAASEEELIRIEKPYWNHDGGTIAFGPDGYLYITHGDGGLANDPHENGQKTNTFLGKVLRIDVDHKGDGKPYAIPKDNTGALWAGEVGQNVFEEINLIQKGGNYGWSVRESMHPFSAKGVDVNDKMIEPIWEYHHDIGLSITGGNVYRGKAIPALEGMYLYGDYVSNRFWALKYDEKAGRVVANHPLEAPALAVMSFGEDEDGEVYAMQASADGKGIYRIVKK
jgi:glucose/arabinose dehydrogenase